VITSPSFNRLAEADLVGQQQPQWFGGHGTIEDGELVWQRIQATSSDREGFTAGHGAPRQPSGGAPDDLVRQPLPIGEQAERRDRNPL
jgi:hypothetical protein